MFHHDVIDHLRNGQILVMTGYAFIHAAMVKGDREGKHFAYYDFAVFGDGHILDHARAEYGAFGVTDYGGGEPTAARRADVCDCE